MDTTAQVNNLLVSEAHGDSRRTFSDDPWFTDNVLRTSSANYDEIYLAEKRKADRMAELCGRNMERLNNAAERRLKMRAEASEKARQRALMIQERVAAVRGSNAANNKQMSSKITGQGQGQMVDNQHGDRRILSDIPITTIRSQSAGPGRRISSQGSVNQHHPDSTSIAVQARMQRAEGDPSTNPHYHIYPQDTLTTYLYLLILHVSFYPHTHTITQLRNSTERIATRKERRSTAHTNASRSHRKSTKTCDRNRYPLTPHTCTLYQVPFNPP